MAAPIPHKVRRVGVIGVTVVAMGLVGAVVVVLVSDEERLDLDDVFPNSVYVDESRRPDFEFPESVRSYDLSLNRFIDRFARVCMEARYSDFRLMLSTRRGGPIDSRRFESMFLALRRVRILSLEQVPAEEPHDPPRFVMRAQYELEDYASRGKEVETIQLGIAKEDGVWKIGAIPKSDLARLEAYRRAAAARDASPEHGPESVPSRSQPNRPASIDG